MKHCLATIIIFASVCTILAACEKDPYSSDSNGSGKTSGKNSKHEYVDLGLPSGVKWATCNVGATAPEEYGDYFAWGETQPYYSSRRPLTWKVGKSAGYYWASYQWCNGSVTTLTKYNTSSLDGPVVDDKVTLEPADDAARVILGGKWRIPTREEWEELLDKCTWKWTSRGGVNGYKVTGPNGNSIFLPAAGRRYFDYLRGGGSSGFYWSSSLNTDSPYDAFYLDFYCFDVGMYSNYRYYGQSVRPVTE